MKINFFDKLNYIKNHLVRTILVKKIGYDDKHGYSLVKSSKLLDYFERVNNGDWFLKQAYDYDKFGYMSQKLGEELEQQFNDEDYVMGIHRTGFTLMNSEMIEEFFNNGLINSDKSMQGSSNVISNDIENTVSIFNKFQYLISQIKSANGYNDSLGCMILKIPKSSLGLNNSTPIPIYQLINGRLYVNPEFIYGYIPVDNKGNTGEIIHNPNYKDKHELNGSNLVYESIVLTNAKTILFRIYEQTYLKYGKEQADGALVNFIMNNNVNYFTGEKNRELLINRIDIYKCIKKLQYPNGITKDDLKEVINEFESRIVSKKSKGITK